MAKLTDKQKKKIISEKVQGATNKQLALKYHVSETTIRNTIKKDPKSAKKFSQKKEENTKSVLEHMDKKKDLVCEIIDGCLGTLADPKRLATSNTREIATALGIIIDKFTKNGADEETGKSEEKQANLLNAIKEAVNGGNK